jgi:hypothetical protein
MPSATSRRRLAIVAPRISFFDLPQGYRFPKDQKFSWFKLLSKAMSNEGNAPDFVEVGEAGIAVDHAMRRRLAVQSCS